MKQLARKHVEMEWRMLYSILAKLHEQGIAEDSIEAALDDMAREEFPPSISQLYWRVKQTKTTSSEGLSSIW